MEKLSGGMCWALEQDGLFPGGGHWVCWAGVCMKRDLFVWGIPGVDEHRDRCLPHQGFQPSLHPTQELLQGLDLLPKLPFWLGWRIQHQGREHTKHIPAPKAWESLPNQLPLTGTASVWPLNCGSIQRKSLVLRWGAALPWVGHSLAEMHPLNYFIIWKRFCVEMGSGPQSCDRQSSSSASSMPNPPTFRIRKVKNSVSSPLDGSRRGEERFLREMWLSFSLKFQAFCFTLLELPARTGFTVLFPFGSAPNAPGAAHTTLNFSSHL